jgi:polyvinyl alcohol dehydrogenase (cytochrome)
MLKNIRVALGSLALLSMSALTAANWPSVNFDHQNSRDNDNETTLNPSNVGNLSLLWTRAGLTGLVNVAPIVANGIVYFGDTTGQLFAVDENTGADVYGPITIGPSIDGPVTVVGNTVYATTSDLILYAFNLDLTPNLAFNGGSVVIDPTAVGKAQVYAGPVVVENILYIPITANSAEIYFNLFPTTRGTINAFNATTGALQWRTQIVAPTDGSQGGAWSTPSVDTHLNRLYIGTTNSLSPPVSKNTTALLSLDLTTGEIVWSRQYTKDALWGLLYPAGKDYDIGASPNLFSIHNHKDSHSDHVVGVGSKAGIYRVFDRKHGHEIWKARMTPKDEYISVNGNPSAAVAEDTVFTICNYDTSGLPVGVLNMYLVMSNPIVQAQVFPLFIASFSLYDNTMIKALNARNGEEKWSNNFVGSTLASITYANGVLYTGNFNGIFRALDAETGDLLFSTNIINPISSPISVVNGKAFVVTGLVGPGFLPSGGSVSAYALP